jgi:2,4-dienoyl-CoA reductase-like NADH-dependent reductase (Old Yellow Enzyme family)/thioredoxin reductase
MSIFAFEMEGVKVEAEKKVEFKKLFEPISIGKLTVKNRIVKLAAQTNTANIDGSVSEKMLYHYAEIARGGVGLLIVEGAIVDQSVVRATASGLVIDHDKYIPRLEELATIIKVNGARATIQIAHTGRATQFPEAGITVAASDVPLGDRIVRPLTIDEIQHLVERFGEAALRAKKAGFDAVEIHGCHGYRIASFMSPFLNKRTDRYGGSLEKRMRFPLEVIECVRSKVGDDYPVIFRISGDEWIEGGLRLEDTKVISGRLEEAGIDAIDVSNGLGETSEYIIAPMAHPPGFAVHLAEGIKSVVRIPVIAVGRIHDPLLAESILQEGKADLIGMGRALFADPELPKKTVEGRLGDIRKCIACNECTRRFYGNLSVRCTVNAAMGREKEFDIRSAVNVKRVLIVGGGAAGMEAVRVAALRGHKVMLYDQANELGGQIRLASVPPYRGEIKNVSEYFSNQIRKLGVKFELNKKVTLALIKEIKPDVVILATGSTPLLPEIPGINRDNVVLANDVLAGKTDVGETVVVAGGGMVGSEVAEFLAEKGKKVTIVEMLNEIASDMEVRTRKLLMSRLAKHGVKMFTGVKIDEVTEEGMSVINKKRERHVIKADTILMALGAKANNKLAEELKDRSWEFYCIGDCVEPRRIIDAIYEGSYVARQI